jgi:hypothetical protein
LILDTAHYVAFLLQSFFGAFFGAKLPEHVKKYVKCGLARLAESIT